MRTYKTTYTKHYYIEGERICSKIGGGFQWAHTPPTSNPIDFIEGNPHTCSMHLREMVDRNTQCAEYDGEMDIRPELAPAHNNGNEYENLQYFYHPDHLGSASFVTDREGAVCQHLQYLPFGELFVSQRNSEFDSRYKFTAKELDNETSYTYFGARYYDADLSSWLSVDPLSDKYPSLSPYLYSADNPVVLVDPNGMLIDWYMNEETGELYYNKDRSSQTTQYNNKTYTRIGDNNMFGDMGNTTEKAYNYEQSQNFAEKNGYSINSTQQLEQHETKTYSDATSPAKSSSESITIINEKYGIFSSDANHKVVTKSEHLENDFGVLDFIFAIGGTSIVDSRSRVFSTYLNDSDFKKSGLKEEMVEKIPAGTLYTQYKSWDDYSIRTKGKGELLIYRKKE